MIIKTRNLSPVLEAQNSFDAQQTASSSAFGVICSRYHAGIVAKSDYYPPARVLASPQSSIELFFFVLLKAAVPRDLPDGL